MVWGVLPPGGVGDYSAYGEAKFNYKGEYIKEDDLHRAYFIEHLADLPEPGPWEAADGRNFPPIVKYVSWARKKTYLDHGPLLEHEWPVEFQMKKRPKNLAALAGGSLNKMVNGELKSLIEEFEPGVHQFAPVKLLLSSGEEYPVQYYTFVIRK